MLNILQLYEKTYVMSLSDVPSSKYGVQNPAETSPVVFGDNFSAKTMILLFLISFCNCNAVVIPIIPPPITAILYIFQINSDSVKVVKIRTSHENYHRNELERNTNDLIIYR